MFADPGPAVLCRVSSPSVAFSPASNEIHFQPSLAFTCHSQIKHSSSRKHWEIPRQELQKSFKFLLVCFILIIFCKALFAFHGFQTTSGPLRGYRAEPVLFLYLAGSHSPVRAAMGPLCAPEGHTPPAVTGV